MAIGERIHFFRTLRGMTQKYLGACLGFDDKSADVRIAQYESGARSPKGKYLTLLADTLEVSPLALSVPDIDSYDSLMHTLFALEDIYGLKITNIDGEICLGLKKVDNPSYTQLFDNFNASSLDIVIQYHTYLKDFADFFTFKQEIQYMIMDVVEANDTDFAFNTQTIIVENN